jgi:nucleotide-binding universal stress UspA family protein
VLVARSHAVSKLVLATDGSDVARGIPDVLEAWSVFKGLDAEAVSVAPPPDRGFELLAEVYTLGSYQLTEDRQEMTERYRRIAADMAERLATIGMHATSTVVVGDPAGEIIAAAKRSAADLIVIGSRGLRGLDRLFLGSVARNVILHAPCSALVIRPSPTEPESTPERVTAAAAV